MTAFTDEKEKSNREDYNSKRIHNTASGKYTSLTEYERNNQKTDISQTSSQGAINNNNMTGKFSKNYQKPYSSNSANTAHNNYNNAPSNSVYNKDFNDYDNYDHPYASNLHINYSNTHTNQIQENDYKSKQLKHENEMLREENLNLKRFLEREKSKSYRLEEEIQRSNLNIINVSELEELKNKIRNVEKENEEIKYSQDKFIHNSQEKLSLFLKICRKYIKKIKNLIILYSKIETSNIHSVSESKDMMLLELNQTVDKFNQTIHNPKLVNTLLDLTLQNVDINSKLLMEEIDPTEDNYFRNEFSLTEVVNKLEAQIKKLSEENKELLLMRNELQSHTQNSSEQLSEKNEEINRLKRKLNDEKLSKDELEQSIQYVKQLNKDLDSKMTILEDENNTMKKNLKSSNEKLKEFELIKNKNINLENELKYKESIISYLETLLKSNNITYSESKLLNGSGGFNNMKNGEFGSSLGSNKHSKFKSSGRFDMDNNIKLDIALKEDSFGNSNSKYNFDQSDHEFRFKPSYMGSPIVKENEISHNRDKERERDLNINKENNRDLNILNISKTSNLKSEIDNLDGEIKHLQNKLRIMIDVNKTK